MIRQLKSQLKTCLLILMLGAPASQASRGDAQILRIFKLGQAPQGHCTAFVDPHQLAVHTAGHCSKTTELFALDRDGQIQQSYAESDRQFYIHPLGVVDAMTMADQASPEVLESPAIPRLDLRTINTSAPYVGLGFPGGWRELSEPSRLLCEEASAEGFTLSQMRLEQSLGTLHLKCWALEIEGQVLPLSELGHAEIAGMSGGPVVADGEIVGILYHFDERTRLVKVQRLNQSLSRNPYEQVVRRYQLDRRLFEEVKLPNRLHLQIMDLFLSSGIPLTQRDELTAITRGEDSHQLHFANGPTVSTQQSLGVLLSNYLDWISSPSQ